jgi:hypothetical protein
MGEPGGVSDAKKLHFSRRTVHQGNLPAADAELVREEFN